MTDRMLKNFWSRRDFLKLSAAGLASLLAGPFRGRAEAAALAKSPVFWVDQIPDAPFTDSVHPNYHAGVEALLNLQGANGLKFYRSAQTTPLSGPNGLIASDDVVLIKVNAQWNYRGTTNSDVIRGLIQRILDHPDGYTGEVVMFENGQGRGSLACDTSASYGNSEVHANANDENQSFLYLVSSVFNDPRVSAKLMDPVRSVFLAKNDHVQNGYRHFENVSYPCFTTDHGRRIELREGVWTGNSFSPKLKLINVPVLKHHDVGGSEITASLKHFYGVVSMSDGNSGIRHYSKLGQTCGKMAVAVRTPVLNIIDAIWVSQASITGYPESTTFRANKLIASQDPVALDTWAAKYVLYPIDNNSRHLPTFPGIKSWLTQARNTINARGGLYKPSMGIQVAKAQISESMMAVYHASAAGA
jgi:uncharacterized protein (DUF362 family)